ncbi:probable pectinesterase 8 [Tripterygium wilfordii]|uniref:probable pectinesterase 8 n=1 Tax=Tripterygium wilfordii TaxID=458696 RepID=UPI0018F80E1E|nr:probable pectinesterase 8 [Tripterygium wilfordii]
MILATRCLSSLVAALAIFASTTSLIIPNYPSLLLNYLTKLIVTTSSSTTLVGLESYEHHRRYSDKGKTVSVCDDFPVDIPPPDTNTASYLCVDRNGCCNFTTVQAAVDAIANISMKRTIIWINSGIYYYGSKNQTEQNIPRTRLHIDCNRVERHCNSTGGTFYSGSVQVFSNNFVAKNISFMIHLVVLHNTHYGPFGSAVYFDRLNLTVLRISFAIAMEKAKAPHFASN